jgi:tight adherence protein B
VRPLIAAIAFALAGSVLTFWLGDKRRHGRLVSAARQQVGLDAPVGEVDDEPRRTFELPPPKIIALAVLPAVAGVAAVGPVGVVAGAIPLLVRRSVLKSRARRRALALDAALGPALQLVIDQLRVGRTVSAAIESTIPSVDEPLAGILQRVVNEHRLGVPIAAVLETAAQEEANRHLLVTSSAIALQARRGGSLAEILGTVASSIEEEDRLRRDLLTLTADARLSANVLLAMPAGSLVMTSLLSPGYAMPLITTSAGRVLSVVGLTLGVVGVVWLRHLAQPEDS